MTEPWEMKFDKGSLHANIRDAIKALSDWLILPDSRVAKYIVTVRIEEEAER